MVKSRADNNVKNAVTVLNCCQNIVWKNKLVWKPASSIVVAMYLTHLIESRKPEHVFAYAVYAIKWLHSINDLKWFNGQSLSVQTGWGFQRRMMSYSGKEKDIIDSKMLHRLCALYLVDQNGRKSVCRFVERLRSHISKWRSVRNLAMVLLSYAGF